MTAVDAMALVAGFGVAFQVRPTLMNGSIGVTPPAWVSLASLVAWVFWTGEGALSAVVWSRIVRYRRLPTSAEWLVILATVDGLIDLGPRQDVDSVLMVLVPRTYHSGDSLVGWGWLVAGMILAGVAGGLALLRRSRKQLPPWAQTTGLVVLADLLLAGPIRLFALQGPDLVTLPGGFGLGNLGLLGWSTAGWFGAIPHGLCYGVPALAAWRDRAGGRPWRWTEGVGAAWSMLLVLTLSAGWARHFPGPSVWWVAERALIGVWLVGVAWLSRWILIRFGPAWTRWFGDQIPPDSLDASPARTFET